MASSTESSSGTPISPEQLIALNDEIAALIRSGIPLELGLREFGGDSRGGLSRISSQLSECMSRGESLPEALAAEENRFPRAYRAIVEAGLRAGRLPAALEAVSSFTWEMLDFRRELGLAALYPLTIFALAYGMFLLFLAEIVSRYQSAFETFRIPLTGLLQFFVTIRDSMAMWAWILPVVILIAICWLMAALRGSGGFSAFPFVGVKHYRFAMFAELLAVQIEHSITLPEGIVLSAEATGSPAMKESARLLADHVSQGGNMTSQPALAGAFPPFLRWLMIDGERQGKLSHALRLAAEMYRRRATNSLIWFKTLFPVLTGLFIGGGIVLLYALGLFMPFIEMLDGLSTGDMRPLQ
jgi:general secretion pathway protein F